LGVGLTTPTWKKLTVHKPIKRCQIDQGRRPSKRNKDKDKVYDVEEDIRKLGVKRWRRKALDREEWASIIKEAKAKL